MRKVALRNSLASLCPGSNDHNISEWRYDLKFQVQKAFKPKLMGCTKTQTRVLYKDLTEMKSGYSDYHMTKCSMVK